MPPIPSYLNILFLLTLPIPPLPSFERGHWTISAFGFPTALSLIPREVFITTPTPRSWEVARCVQYLVWAWAGLGVLQAVRRTVIRLKRGSLRLDHASGGTDTSTSTKGSTGTNTNTDTSDLKSPSSAPTGPATITPPRYPLSSQSALWTTIILHLISWRLATTLILPDLPGAWKWPFDLTTLIGISTGLICSWGEVWSLLQMTGLAGTSIQTLALGYGIV